MKLIYLIIFLLLTPLQALATRYYYQGTPDFSLYGTLYTLTSEQHSSNQVSDTGFFHLSFDDSGQNVSIQGLLNSPDSPNYSSIEFNFNIPVVFGSFNINASTGEFQLGPCCGSDTIESYLQFNDSTISDMDYFSLSIQEPESILQAYLVNNILQLDFKWFIGTNSDAIFEMGRINTPIQFTGVNNPEPATMLLLLSGLPFFTRKFYAKSKT